MNTRERITAVWHGQSADKAPLIAQCFGMHAPPPLRWEREGEVREYWYSLRMEHLHQFGQTWELDDDFQRVLAWRSLGVDDILDVSVPWSVDPEVTWEDSYRQDSCCPVMLREYNTPKGRLRHAVLKTCEESGRGWVKQPEEVKLIEDFNIPRGVEHAVQNPNDIAPLKHLYCPPDSKACQWFEKRMEKVRTFAEREGVPVQAWTGFGMDAVVWFAGTEGAILLAMDYPKSFAQLMAIITETDLARTMMAASTLGVDMVVIRGWYSSTSLWSPTLFNQHVFPYVSALADAAHQNGKKLGYVMTTGVEMLGPRLADAGVDVLYFVDPLQDGITLERSRELFSERLTVAGGINTISLQTDTPEQIKEKVQRAMDILGPTNRFILQPVDSLFPDTPWSGIEAMITAWDLYS